MANNPEEDPLKVFQQGRSFPEQVAFTAANIPRAPVPRGGGVFTEGLTQGLDIAQQRQMAAEEQRQGQVFNQALSQMYQASQAETPQQAQEITNRALNEMLKAGVDPQLYQQAVRMGVNPPEAVRQRAIGTLRERMLAMDLMKRGREEIREERALPLAASKERLRMAIAEGEFGTWGDRFKDQLVNPRSMLSLLFDKIPKTRDAYKYLAHRSLVDVTLDDSYQNIVTAMVGEPMTHVSPGAGYRAGTIVGAALLDPIALARDPETQKLLSVADVDVTQGATRLPNGKYVRFVMSPEVRKQVTDHFDKWVNSGTVSLEDVDGREAATRDMFKAVDYVVLGLPVEDREDIHPDSIRFAHHLNNILTGQKTAGEAMEGRLGMSRVQVWVANDPGFRGEISKFGFTERSSDAPTEAWKVRAGVFLPTTGYRGVDTGDTKFRIDKETGETVAMPDNAIAAKAGLSAKEGIEMANVIWDSIRQQKAPAKLKDKVLNIMREMNTDWGGSVELENEAKGLMFRTLLPVWYTHKHADNGRTKEDKLLKDFLERFVDPEVRRFVQENFPEKRVGEEGAPGQPAIQASEQMGFDRSAAAHTEVNEEAQRDALEQATPPAVDEAQILENILRAMTLGRVGGEAPIERPRQEEEALFPPQAKTPPSMRELIEKSMKKKK